MRGVNKSAQALILVLFFSACTPTSSVVNSQTSALSASPTPVNPVSTYAPGSRVAQIIFQASTNQTSAAAGSFNSLQSQGHTQGTAPTPGFGHPAVRVFNSDGSLQGSMNPSTGTKTSWPAWLSSFEVGISGAINTSAPNPNCATFSSSTEPTLTNCQLGSSASPTPSQCGAPLGQFRVSEVDCSIPTDGLAQAAPGIGGPADGIYMRAVFSRPDLGPTENILVVLQYSASALDPAPANPTHCYVGGKFLPENCSDFVWRAYLKHSTTEVVMPYLLLIPPTFSSVLGSSQVPAGPSGMGIGTKQFLLPLASDPNLSVLQISRTQSAFPNSGASLKNFCTSANSLSVSTPGNSPNCAGVVFYSITFYRI